MSAQLLEVDVPRADELAVAVLEEKAFRPQPAGSFIEGF